MSPIRLLKNEKDLRGSWQKLWCSTMDCLNRGILKGYIHVQTSGTRFLATDFEACDFSASKTRLQNSITLRAICT